MNRGIPFVIFRFMHSFSVQSLCLLQNRNMNINTLVLLHTQGITPLIQYYIIIKYFKSINKEEFSVHHYNLKQIYLLSSSVIISSFSLSLLSSSLVYTLYYVRPTPSSIYNYHFQLSYPPSLFLSSFFFFSLYFILKYVRTTPSSIYNVLL